MGSFIAVTLAVIAIFSTVIPFVKTSAWQVRAFDYPKAHVLIVTIASLVLWFVYGPGGTVVQWALAVLLLMCTVYNAWLVLRFTPIWRKQVATAHGNCEGDRVSLFMSNVLMENRDFDAVLAAVRKDDADIVMLCETDAAWVEAMKPLEALYPHVTRQPQENHYGMMFLTRMDVESVDVRFLVNDETPSIRAVLRTPSGRRITFLGLHPEPPLPGQDSHKRDAELMVVAKEIKGTHEPTIVAGDLNDVAWSHTTRKFKRISRMLDPRVGRGYYASFHADYWFARWPLDHLFHTGDFELVDLALFPSVGSDHFPVTATLSLVPGKSRNEEQDPETEMDVKEAFEVIERGIQDRSFGLRRTVLKQFRRRLGRSKAR